MGILFTGGTIITASDTIKADILVEGETIRQIGQALDPGGHQVIDCTGKLIMPGGIDVHTHLDLPFGTVTASNDDFITGHRAAAFGGTTSHIDFISQPKGGSLHDGLAIWRKKAAPASIDYGFHMSIFDPREEVLAEIPSLLDEGITTLKLFLAYKDMYQIDDMTLFRVMQIARSLGMLVMIHAENGDVEAVLRQELVAAGKTTPYYHAHSRPPEIEGEATNRAVMMSGLTGCPLYVVHVTCEPSVEAIQRGRAKGYPVMGETCTQYFFLNAERDLGAPNFEGAKFVCSPPIRTDHDHAVLWQAVRNGTLQAISTDHCDFWWEGGRGPWQEWQAQHPVQDWVGYEAQDPSYRRPGKELGRDNFARIPNGLPGIEERLMVIWEHGVNQNRISANRFVELCCTNPAKIFGMYPRKGTIAVGSDADLAIWDPNFSHTLSVKNTHMRIDYILYEGMAIHGKPEKVFLRGKMIVDGDQWLGQQGQGHFIHRQPFASVL